MYKTYGSRERVQPPLESICLSYIQASILKLTAGALLIISRGASGCFCDVIS